MAAKKIPSFIILLFLLKASSLFYEDHYMKGAKLDDLLITDVFWSCQDFLE